MFTIHIQDLAHIREAARQFIDQLDGRTVIALYGPMGSGKTTFIKAICQELGVTDIITSPTFAIVNEYQLPTRPKDNCTERTAIYHFDFYRIKQLAEVYDMGYEEYFYSGALCFIEWPELIEELLPPDTLRISISQQPDGSRVVSLKEEKQG